MNPKTRELYTDLINVIHCNDELFQLPINYGTKNIQELLHDKLYKYECFFNQNITPLIQDKNITFHSIRIDSVFDRIKVLNECIILTVNKYLDGKPYEASKYFADTLDNIYLNKLQFEYIIPEKTLFFRAREKSKYQYSKKELFHIPFQKRNYASTSRYSIPGVPALYLGDNTYTCWEEINRPNFKELYYSVFENVSELNTIQILRTEDLLMIINSDVTENFKIFFVLQFLIYFPISIACSIKVKDRNANFKPEYIIPQMLLEYVIQNNRIDGIKFPSTKINYNNLKNVPAYNYIFPIKKSQDFDYCPILKEKFILSEPSSLELEELLNNPVKQPTILYSDEEFSEQPEKIKIVENDEREYYNTSFGKLDKILEEKSRDKL